MTQEARMNLVYNSSNYSVVEYPSIDSLELIDKQSGTASFLRGGVAARLRDSIEAVMATSPTMEAIDEVLGGFDSVLAQRIAFH
jgi:hypothetical protein